MKLSIRSKMFLLVTFVLMSSILAVLWKTRTIFFEDKYDFIRQLSSKLSASTGRLAQQELSQFQNNMALFVSTRESLKKIKSGKELSSVLFERTPEFLVVSVQKNKNKSNWETEWSQVDTETTWEDSFVETILRSINYSTLATGTIHLNRVTDSQGHPFFVLSFLANLKEEAQPTGAAAASPIRTKLSSIVAILKPNFLSDVVRDFKGDLNSVFLVDNKGYVIAHPQDNLIGTEDIQHPVVKAIVSGRENGSGQFEMSNGEKIIANFNSISGTNLYLIITTPEKQAFLAARDLIITVITFGFGFLIIGSVLTFIISSRITKPLNELTEIAAVIGSGDFKTEVNITSSDEVGKLARSIDKMKKSLLERDDQIEHSKMALVQSEKMSAFGQLSAGIAHEVKNPLAGILGHAQLAKTKVKDPDLAKHLDMIEKETRRTKEIIENLMKFARAEKPELSPTDLHETVSRAVDLVDHQISLQGIKIVKDFHPVSQTHSNSNQIQQVLLNLMMNAGHAMENCKTKELKVSVEDVGANVQIRIKDTGAGMTPEVQKRVFEPFFTTKPAGKGTGLGLSVSIGIVQDHKGKIYVESQVGKGTTFFIDIPKYNANSVAAAVSEKSKVIDFNKKQNEKTKSAFPEFNAPKVEHVIDKEVQRDYLKASAQNSKDNIKSLEEIKKEAQEILKKEKDLFKKEESKLSDVLQMQQKESSQILNKNDTKKDSKTDSKTENTQNKFNIASPNTKAAPQNLGVDIETINKQVLNFEQLNKDHASLDAAPEKSVSPNPKTKNTGNFKVNIRKPKMKA